MTEQEQEFKKMLSKEDYHFLLRFFSKFMVSSGLQTNYYYDTREETMRKRNTTVRIRQKNHNLIGTVKRHLGTNNRSVEEHFQVDSIPRVVMLDNIPLWLKGSLKTERTVFKVCDDIMLMLDQNQYLGTVDYELEIEFSESCRKQAEGILMLIQNLLETKSEQNSASKSERFFRRLSVVGGATYV